MEIRLDSVHVGGVYGNAAVLFGENRLAGWRTRVKTNSGLSRISGDCNLVGGLGNYVCDPDAVDVAVREAGEDADDCDGGGVARGGADVERPDTDKPAQR